MTHSFADGKIILLFAGIYDDDPEIITLSYSDFRK